MPSSEPDKSVLLAFAAMRYMFPSAQWRLARVDGVQVIFAAVSEVADSAREEMLKIVDEEPNPPKETT